MLFTESITDFFIITPMKRIIILLLAFSLQSCFLFWSPEDTHDMKYKPVLMNRSDFEKSVSLKNPTDIVEAGKIYTYNDYLFINEKYIGFHVYDNSNPEQPKALSFIHAPGATDMAIKNDVVYINQATDLIAVRLSGEPLQIKLTKRIPQIFPELRSPDGLFFDTPPGKVIVKWIKK